MNRVHGTPRYAHAEGHTDVCFSENGEYIITCGSDGDVRMYKGIEDDDVPAKCVGEKAFAVVQKDNKLYVGSDHNYVQILTYPDVDIDCVLTRFTAPVNTIDCCKDGTLVVAGSSDSEIHVVEVTSKIVKYFSGHKAPILKVSIDPKKEYIASSSCDGTVRIWKIEDQTVVREWSNVIKSCNSFHNSESLCCISWEPLTGRLLAIPYPNEVRLIQRSTWNVIVTLSNPVSPDLSLTAWSSCGRFLAASSLKGHVFVWNTLINKLVSSYNDKLEINICALQWHPDSDVKQIAFCDVRGQLSMLENCYPAAKKNSSVSEGTHVEDKYDAVPDDDDDDDPDAISLEKIKSDFSYLDDEMKRNTKDDDIDSLSSKSSDRYENKPVFTTDLQLPFQPTSTPIHLQRRFMVFNDVGYVRQTNTEDENMIDVDFHDASLHHAFRMNNLLNHVLAALNSEALVLACEKTLDSTSKLVGRLFKTWDSTKEWSVEMPSNESIEAIAIGLKWIGAVTSLRLLRLFSLSGVQREIICLPGPIVSVNAAEDLLIVVYHGAAGLPGEQNLFFAVYQITFDVKVLVAAQPLPLMPKSTLKWIGFSDQLNPCILDSSGALKLFSSTTGIWKPISFVDSQVKDLSDHYFVIGVSEERQNIRCILCKGSYYPSTTPHPFITEIPWQIPVCDLSVDKGVLEEKFWRFSIAKECLPKEDQKLNTSFKATALKLFALSCRTSHEMRVYELCDIANQPDVIELALKYASKISNDILVQKLSELQHELDTRSQVNDDLNFNTGHDYNTPNTYENSQSNGKGCTNEDYQSQELFPDRSSVSSSSNIPRDNNVSSFERATNDSTLSLIAETRKKKSTSEQRSILPSRKINPFRKAVVNEITLAPESSKLVTNGDVSSCQSSVYKEENLDLPFREWLKLEKDNLTQEFPNVEETDLAREAIKKFKSLKASRASSTGALTNSSSENFEATHQENVSDDQKCSNDYKKRKSVEIASNSKESTVGAKKIKPLLKLQDFKFTKKN